MNLHNLHQRVLGPTGRELFAVGGTKSHAQHEYRGYAVSLEWIDGEPAMVIWPVSNVFVTGEGHGMWVISRRAIVDFVGFTAEGKATGAPSEHCFREAR